MRLGHRTLRYVTDGRIWRRRLLACTASANLSRETGVTRDLTILAIVTAVIVLIY
jgi:hypothetical protein